MSKGILYTQQLMGPLYSSVGVSPVAKGLVIGERVFVVVITDNEFAVKGRVIAAGIGKMGNHVNG